MPCIPFARLSRLCALSDTEPPAAQSGRPSLQSLARIAAHRPPPAPLVFEHRSAASTAHARSVQQSRRTLALVQTLKTTCQAHENLLTNVRSAYPTVGQAMGITRPGRIIRMKRDIITKEQAHRLIALMFHRRVFKEPIGIKPARLRNFGASLVHALQQHGIKRMLFNCMRFKMASPNHTVVLGVSQESDSTKQMLAYKLLQRYGRQSSRRVGVDIMYQACKIHIGLATPTDRVIMTETVLCKPLACLGNSANLVLKCIE